MLMTLYSMHHEHASTVRFDNNLRKIGTLMTYEETLELCTEVCCLCTLTCFW